jgi:DNA-directed RNA polymerase specialized sigma24 family protein
MEKRMRTTRLAQFRQEVADAYLAGATLADIANLYNVSTGTVRNELISQGITRRARGRRKVITAKKEAEPEFNVSALDEKVLAPEEVPVDAPEPVQAVCNEDLVILKNNFGGAE